MKFDAICWEPGVVHILTEKHAKNTNPFKQTLCGQLVPTEEELPVTGNVTVCTACRNVQDLVLRGHSPARARSILAHIVPLQPKRGRHGGGQNRT